MKYTNLKLTGYRLAILSCSIFMISCTKEVPYKQEFKEKIHSKDLFSSKTNKNQPAEFIYAPSSTLTNHDDIGAAGAIPYWQGQEKIVTFRFTESSLQAIEVDNEARLKNNDTNQKIVFEIPIENVDFRCAKDRYGKCTNQEEENRELTWDKKSQFKPHFESLKTVAINLLPIEMDQVFGSSCFTEASSRFMNYELSEDALNIQVEKSFTGDLTCLEKKGIQIGSLGDLQSQIVYQYSFARLDKLASPDYKTVSYPNHDEGIFGFFSTDVRQYDVAYNRLEKMKLQYLNRWNPQRKVINYYLTDNFNKPEFAALKKATQIAFDKVNAGLASAGVDLSLALKDPENKAPGDVRNNMIILVEDPVVSGPLGYGPSVVNPRTGEILSARTAMYYGNLLTGIKRTYDEVVTELRNSKEAAAPLKGLALADDLSEMRISPELEEQTSAAISEQKSNLNKIFSKASYFEKNREKKPLGKAENYQKSSALNFKNMTKRQFEKATLLSDKKSMAKDILGAMSKNCTYPSDLFNFNEAVKKGLQGQLGSELKYWKDLNEQEKTKVIALIAPEIWVPTLAHELGHNLGLRHNFAGSEDKDNFYNATELNAMGVHHKIPYSSVMDYGYSELNSLPTMGKYDIAALRFGYGRQVETKEGTMVSLTSSLSEMLSNKKLHYYSDDNLTTEEKIKAASTAPSPSVTLKEFSYCTDEHVDVNPNCKRFDEGTSISEIVDFMAKSYEDLYTYRNFRNGRENFSKMSDGAVADAVRSRFSYMRAAMERYEALKYKFSISDDDGAWTKYPFMKDLKEAATKSGQFFLKVLKTPDVHCALARKANPQLIVGFEELAVMNPQAVSCFKNVELKDDYIVVGQIGKAFNDKKDPSSENNYADQIDIRGVYIDKIVAAEMLFKRRTGNLLFDAYEDNYTDLPDLEMEIMPTLQALFMNQSQVESVLRNENGQKIGTYNLKNRVFSPPAEQNSRFLAHWIDIPLDADVAKRLGIPMRNLSLQEVLLNIMQNTMGKTSSRPKSDISFMEMFNVVKTSTAYQIDSKAGVESRDVSGIRMIAMRGNIFAGMSIDNANSFDLLRRLDDEKIAKLYHEALTAEKNAGTKGEVVYKDSAFGDEYHKIEARFVRSFSKNELQGELAAYLLMLLPASNAQY